MGSLAVLLGFDAADRLGGGPPDGAGVLVVQVDGDRVGGDVHQCDPTCISFCENFLYGFKAAPRGRSRRRLGTAQPRSRFAPAQLASGARSAGAKGKKAGPQKPGEVTEPRRI